MNDRAALLEQLEHRTGMNVAALGGEHSLDFAIQRCVAAGGFANVADWQRALVDSSALWEKFLHEIVVPETFFFRYPESYQALASWVTQPITRRRPLRILSLPCSTGEEPYSVAIALSEAGFAAEHYEITAVDIDRRAVDFASRGVYHRSSFRSMEANVPSGYFDEKPAGQFTLREFIRRRVKFETHSFWDFAIDVKRWDIILCRNLLIYFSEEKQTAALKKLHSLLHPAGILFLGPAEVPVAIKCGWQSAGFTMAFACQEPKEVVAKPTQPTLLKRLPKVTPPTVRKTRTILPAHSPIPSTTPSLADIKALADRGAVAEAQTALADYLTTDPANADAHTLAGLLAEIAGDTDRAETAFRRAMYLDSNHAEAISHLAWLLRANGRTDAAQKLLDRAERLHLSQ